MTLQQRLDDARLQHHKLVTGQAPKVFVDQNGERIEYVQANANRLAAYIATLEGQLKQSPTGPMRVWM